MPVESRKPLLGVLRRMRSEQGMDTEAIAKHFGVAEVTVYLWYKRDGIVVRRPRRELNKARLRKLIGHISGRRMARRFRVSPSVMYSRLKEYGIRIPRHVTPPKEVLQQMYWDGDLSTHKIAKKLGTTQHRVWTGMVDYGIERRHGSEAQHAERPSK